MKKVIKEWAAKNFSERQQSLALKNNNIEMGFGYETQNIDSSKLLEDAILLTQMGNNNEFIEYVQHNEKMFHHSLQQVLIYNNTYDIDSNLF